MPKPKIQAYNSGFLHVFNITNIAENGKTPHYVLQPKESLRYCERTVGLNRFTQFMQNDVEVSMVVRCQRRERVSTQDVVTMQGEEQYKIMQIQYPQDVAPKSMDLTLQRLVENYATT